MRTIFLLFFFITQQVYSSTCLDVLRVPEAIPGIYSSYEITEKALKHIVHGDIVTSNGVPKIKGGLHSYDSYVKFVESRQDFIYVEDVDRRPGQSWYYAIDSGTGAAYVRLPSTAYTSKSLKSLWGSDLSLNGSFLWKTLFPKDFTQEDIIKAIQAILDKPDSVKNRGWASVLEGRYKYDENIASIAIHVVINTKDKTVVSAYPSFEQGNVEGNTKGLLGFRKQVVFSTTTADDLIWELDTGEAIDDLYDDFLSVKRKTTDPEWWSRLSLDQKREHASAYTFTRVNITGANVGGMDLLYERFKLDSGYEVGEVYGVAAKVARLYVRDRKVDPNVKYDYLKRLIGSLLVNDLRMVSDTLWAKFVINLVLESETQFEKPLFEYLISQFVDSPVLWTLLLKTKNPLFTSSDKVAEGIQNYMSNFLAPSDQELQDLYELQLGGFSYMFDTYKSVWKSEFYFIELLSKHPDFREGEPKAQLVFKLLMDYLNSFIWKVFKEAKVNSGFAPLRRLMDYSHLRKILSLIKRYDENFDKRYAYSFIKFFISPNISDLNKIRDYGDQYGDISVFELIYEQRERFVSERRAMPFVVNKGKAFEFIFVTWMN